MTSHELQAPSAPKRTHTPSVLRRSALKPDFFVAGLAALVWVRPEQATGLGGAGRGVTR